MLPSSLPILPHPPLVVASSAALAASSSRLRVREGPQTMHNQYNAYTHTLSPRHLLVGDRLPINAHQTFRKLASCAPHTATVVSKMAAAAFRRLHPFRPAWYVSDVP